jgi:hypothetical protein
MVVEGRRPVPVEVTRTVGDGTDTKIHRRLHTRMYLLAGRQIAVSDTVGTEGAVRMESQQQSCVDKTKPTCNEVEEGDTTRLDATNDVVQ